jgi:hypothetical protein
MGEAEMDNEDERDGNGQEAAVSEVPPELVDVERYFAGRAGLGMRVPGPGRY